MAVVLTILCSIARAVLVFWAPPFATVYFLRGATIVAADPILIGSILALLSRNSIGGLHQYKRASYWVLSLGVVAASLFELMRRGPREEWGAKTAYIFIQPSLALAFVAMLLLVLLRPPQWLRWGWLEYIGRISYGVYVIHGCISPWLRAHIADAHMRTAVLLAVSILLASLSWKVFEAPILSLKDRWPMPLKKKKNK